MKKIIALVLLAAGLVAISAPSPQNGTVTLAWNYDFTICNGYCNINTTNFVVYYGVGPTNIANWNGTNVVYGVYTGSFNVGGTNLTVTVPGLLRGQRYYFVATAQGAWLESDYSNEVFVDVPKKPGNPKITSAQ